MSYRVFFIAREERDAMVKMEFISDLVQQEKA